MKKEINPTEAELEILRILWNLKEARVKDIHAKINKTRNIGYTTVLKLMQIMFDKKLLERRLEGKSHIYTPTVKQGEIQDKLLNKILNTVYEGSTFDLVMGALGNHKASSTELEKIKNLIKQQQEKLK